MCVCVCVCVCVTLLCYAVCSSQGYAGGAHIAGMSPMYGGFVPAQASGKYREQPVSAPGIVTSASVTASTAQSFGLTQMQGFRLQDLAGRGFIVSR